MRQVVLDTETTGLETAEGHRLIEIAGLELINRKLTGRQFHYYLNPGRNIELGAHAVHGITDDFLKDKPQFFAICDELLEFIRGCELIIHNAPFDLGFIHYELSLIQHACKSLHDHCTVLDSLQLAKKMHVGQRNSLDALCKRYTIDNSKRNYHGALLDAELLARVYLAMTGGQATLALFEDMKDEGLPDEVSEIFSNPKEREPLRIITATAIENIENEKYLEMMAQKGKCLWREFESIV